MDFLADYNEDLLRLALSMAGSNVASGKGGPFAALVVRGNRIIGRGVNRVIEKNDPTAHAEIEAIRDACANLDTFQLDDCYLYSSCEPCPMCLGAIYWARPAAVFYAASRKDAASAGFDDSFIYDELCAPPESRKIPAFRFLETEGLKPFGTWDDHPEKNLY